MYVFLAGLILLVSIILLFWAKDRLQSPLLARLAFSELAARLAVVGGACVIVGLLLILSELF